uniref:Uncharacterized protein n=1 Tax=Anguilla anguilla TaxID=7936 RepID=A0A0E9PZX5_ANGAN
MHQKWMPKTGVNLIQTHHYSIMGVLPRATYEYSW